MKLSAPVYHLKRKAKLLSRDGKIPLHEALERIAVKEGFANWSLLIAKASAMAPAGRLFPRLTQGDLLLVGARPGHGKTLLSLELAVEAMKSGNRSVYFTLEYTERDVLDRFRAIDVDPARFVGLFDFDTSDAISADYIIERLASMPRDTLVVVDYLQLLDQRRENPDLLVQIRALKSFARERGLIMVFISQIDRSYDPSRKPCPDLNDVRLPNPLDLTLFDKTCFLNNGEVRFSAAS
jgi:replicative DNA helicase